MRWYLIGGSHQRAGLLAGLDWVGMDGNDATALAVLVLEDSGLMAMEIEAALADAGYCPVIAANVGEAGAALAGTRFACALLDYRLDDGDCTPVALALDQQGVPVAIVSGYDAETQVPALARFPVFRKPVGAGALLAWVNEMVCRD